jgi:hypothetical protein
MDRYQPRPPRDLATEPYEPLDYSFVSLEGFLDARLLVEVLRRMGPRLERKRLPEVVESIRDFDLGIEHPVSFGPGKHQGSEQVYYTVVRDGRFVRLQDWERWRP